MAAIFEDIHWLVDTLPSRLSSMPDPNTDLAAWIGLVRTSGWLALVNKAMSVSVKMRQQQSDFSQPIGGPDVLAEDSRGHICYHCGAVGHETYLFKL